MPSTGETARGRILLVDDEPDLLTTMNVLLAKQHDVLTATGAEEALGILEREPVDIVITDERMPVMKGTVLLAKVRERHPDVVRMVLSAYNDPEAMLRAINEGEVHRFLLKPTNPVALRQEVADALERQRLQRENRRLLATLETRNEHLERMLAELEQARGKLVRAEKFALAGQLASGFAHDVKNFLSAMTLFQFDGNGGKNPVAAATRRIIDRAVEGIHDLSDELVKLAKGQVPRYTLDRADLAELVSRFVAELEGSPLHETHRIVSDAPAPVYARVAPKKLWRLLWNLTENAATASPEGSRIAIRVFVDDGSSCVAVTDEGPGIPDEIRHRIFEPFFTTHAAGTGLGLEVCKLIAAGHGGTLDCASRPNEGATFTLRLPRDPD